MCVPATGACSPVKFGRGLTCERATRGFLPVRFVGGVLGIWPDKPPFSASLDVTSCVENEELPLSMGGRSSRPLFCAAVARCCARAAGDFGCGPPISGTTGMEDEERCGFILGSNGLSFEIMRVPLVEESSSLCTVSRSIVRRLFVRRCVGDWRRGLRDD